MNHILIENNSFKYSTGTINGRSVSKNYIMKQKNNFKFIYVKKGHLNVTFLNEKIILNKNQCILVNKDVEIVINADCDTEAEYLQFLDLFFNITPELKLITEESKLYNDDSFYKLITCKSNHEQPIFHYLNVLGKLSNRKKNVLNKLLIQNTIQQIILLTVSIYDNYDENFEKSFDETLINELKILISQNIKKERSLKFYSEKLNISCHKLNKICEKALGITFKQFIEMKCINLIKVKLELNSFSLKEIAFEFNFSDVSNFHRFFKRNTGITPKQYLKKIKESQVFN